MPTVSPNALRSWGMGAFVLFAYLIGLGIGICMWNVVSERTLYDWQTLIGAGAALLAAIIGAFFIQRQISAAWKIEEEKRRRKVLATRAVLPVALSALVEYCLACGKTLEFLFWEKHSAELRRAAGADEESEEAAPPAVPAAAAKPLLFPNVPPELIPLFKDYIEHAPESQTLALRTIIRELQVLSANLRDEDAIGEELSLNMLSYAARAAVLHARAEKLFPYAREACGDATIPPTVADAKKALDFFGFDKDQEETLSAYRQVATYLSCSALGCPPQA